jgi:hypothetical protein
MNEALMIKPIQDYLAAWNAQTADERQSLLQGCMTDNAIYIDPHAPESVRGIDGMQALIEKFRSRFDHKFRTRRASRSAPQRISTPLAITAR